MGLRITKIWASRFIIWAVKKINWASYLNLFHFIKKAVFRDTPNYTEKFRGIYTVGWNYRRKRPNTVGKRPTVGIIFRPSPQFFHNFVSSHPIFMFLTILESGDKTKNIEDEFKTI